MAIQKLQYNGRTILNPNRNAYVGFNIPISTLNMSHEGTFVITGTKR